MYEFEQKKRSSVVCSVLVDNASIVVDYRIGEQKTIGFGRGVFRIYSDIRRIEFKQFGGENEGEVFGFPLELVRSYSFLPAKRDDY